MVWRIPPSLTPMYFPSITQPARITVLRLDPPTAGVEWHSAHDLALAGSETAWVRLNTLPVAVSARPRGSGTPAMHIARDKINPSIGSTESTFFCAIHLENPSLINQDICFIGV